MNVRSLLDRFDRFATALQSPVLFLLRAYWGWAFAQTGWGKLGNPGRTAEFFASLDLPFPSLSAWAAGATECFGGVLLLLGLFARPAALPLAGTMLVAYATAHREAVTGLFADPDAFLGADPFLFLLASVLVLAFGPGKWSLDHFRAAARRRDAQAALVGTAGELGALKSDS
jgi:putative oxidoreductase